MLLQAIILVIGFIVLIKGADYFVDGASSIAKNLKVPDILIGLTIVAFGTSAPEAAVSIKAVLTNSSDIVIGNVVGSNILNILLILGVSSVIIPLHVNKNTINKEIPFLIIVSILLSVLLLDDYFGSSERNMITRGDGIAILLTFIIFIDYLFGLAKSEAVEAIEAKYPLKKAIIYAVLGIVAIVLGGNFVVDSASNIATRLGIGQRFIALTIVAFGTSLPELVTSILASRKGEQDLAIGNIIGSNIFNICFVIGFPAAAFGNIIPNETSLLDLGVMLLATILLFGLCKVKKQITRGGGILLLALFVVYYGYLIVSQLSSIL